MDEPPVAVITGASSGIGAETALALARRGYAVVLAARRVERLEEVADRCEQAGARARVVPTDVGVAGQVESLVQAAVDEFGRVDVMLNNAGFGICARVHETSEEQMRAILEVNFLAVFYGCKAVAPVMIRQRGGHIFNVSSIVGMRGVPFNGVYCAAKFAVRGLTDCLRVEMRPHNVKVTCVCPGLTDGEFFDKVDGGERQKRSMFRRMRSIQQPAHVAGKIAAAVGKSRPELVFTLGGKAMALLGAVSPRLTDALMGLYYRDLARATAMASNRRD